MTKCGPESLVVRIPQLGELSFAETTPGAKGFFPVPNGILCCLSPALAGRPAGKTKKLPHVSYDLFNGQDAGVCISGNKGGMGKPCAKEETVVHE